MPAGHPLRLIRAVVDEALEVLLPEFDRLYASVGRPGIAPEKLLRALLIQAFYSVRSERQLMEQFGYKLVFRWFVGLAMDAPAWDATTFSRTATVCWTVMWRSGCWRPWWRSRGCGR